MKKETPNIYYTKEVVSGHSLSELDFDLGNKLGFDYEVHDDLINITFSDEKEIHTYEATPVEIDIMLDILNKAKKNGATHVEIEDHIDHHGYEITTFKIGLATEKEVKQYKEKEKALSKKDKSKRIKALEKALAELLNE